MADKILHKKIRVVWIILLAGIILSFLSGCGSKKSVSQSQVKEKTDIELTDNSKINTKIEQEQQYVNTNTKERIVTYYGVKMVPYPVNGDTVLIPFPYPEKKEEDREIVAQMIKDLFTQMDSTQKAVELKYKSQIEEKDKKILEAAESTQMLQIAILIGSIAALFLIFLAFRLGWNKSGKYR